MDLQQQLERLQKANIGLAAISYDSAEILASFAAQNSIQFPLLSDQTSDVTGETIRRYGLIDPRESGKYSGVPVPTIVVIDAKKRVNQILRGSIKQRPDISRLIDSASN